MGIQTLGPIPNTSKPISKAYKYPYLLRNLNITRPNQVWATDITYIPMQKGFLFLSAIIDWHSRYILHWDISNCMDKEWCVKLLQDTLERYPKPEIFNSDQGSQYTSELFTSVLLGREIKISMDGRGRALDNIIIERFWRTIKYEHIYLRPACNGLELYDGIEKFILKYNQVRRHTSLNKSTPYKTYKQII
jgi:putative transposase